MFNALIKGEMTKEEYTARSQWWLHSEMKHLQPKGNAQSHALNSENLNALPMRG